MANYENFDLQMVEVPEGRETCLYEVIKCSWELYHFLPGFFAYLGGSGILHTILFHRALGATRPADGCVNDIDLDYVSPSPEFSP